MVCNLTTLDVLFSFIYFWTIQNIPTTLVSAFTLFKEY